MTLPTYHDCPFCGERDFDLSGLKGHLQSDCEVFRSTEAPHRIFGMRVVIDPTMQSDTFKIAQGHK